MKINIIQITNPQLAYKAALSTIGKTPIKSYTSDWYGDLIKSEHSPLRTILYWIELIDIPYYSSVHLSRHKIGVEHFVSTQRSDRTNVSRDSKPQDSPVNHTMFINAQSILNISRERMCNNSDPKTIEIWDKVVKRLKIIDPILSDNCVPKCVYKKQCDEFTSCGYWENLINKKQE